MSSRRGFANRDSLRLEGSFFRFNRAGKYDQGFFASAGWELALAEANYCFTFGHFGKYIMRIRREVRHSCNYWYALKNVGGKTRKVYVGKDLSVDALRLAQLKMKQKWSS